MVGQRDANNYSLLFSYRCRVDELLETLVTRMRYTNIIKSRVETESNLGYVLSTQDGSCSNGAGCCQVQGSCCNTDGNCAKPTPLSSSCQNRTNASGTSCAISSGCHTTTPTLTGLDTNGHASSADSSTKRRRFGRTYNLPEGDNIGDYSLFYVGGESPTLSNIMMTHSKCEVYSYNPEKKEGRLESAQVNKALMRRYFLVQKAKDADVIGIAVGTLGVGNSSTRIT